VSSTGTRTPVASSAAEQNTSSAAALAGDQRSTATLGANQGGSTAGRPSATTPNAAASASGAHPGVRIPNRRHASTTPAPGGGTAATGPAAAAAGASSAVAAAAAAAAANGPTRIPLSQRRDPPPKLSLTLDLSVTNPRAGNTSKHVDPSGVPLASALRRRDAVVPDSSFGIAASSGVVRTCHSSRHFCTLTSDFLSS